MLYKLIINDASINKYIIKFIIKENNPLKIDAFFLIIKIIKVALSIIMKITVII